MKKGNPESQIAQKLLQARHTNAKGSVIRLHHAFATLRFSPMSQFSMILLPFVFCNITWLALGPITEIWGQIFQFWLNLISDGSGLSWHGLVIFSQAVNVPVPALVGAIPSDYAVWWNLFGCMIVFLITFFIPQTFAPFSYLLRATLLIQWSASVFFMVSPDWFPYDIENYVADALGLGLYLLFLIPLIYTAILYIFEFPLWWKFMITLMTLGFFVVALPFQYMLHAWVIHNGTLLFLPQAYFMFGILIDVLMFISFYALGMSWRGKRAGDLGRFA